MASSGIGHLLRHAALVAAASLTLVIATSIPAHAMGSLLDQVTDCFGNTHYRYQVIFVVPGSGTATWGTSGDDVIIGSSEPDVINSLEGNDTICGGDAADTLRTEGGPADHDLVDGENGSDTIYAQAGADTLRGGALDDTIWGEDGDDDIRGGPGNDTIHAGAGSDTVQCDDGEDDFADGGTSTPYDIDTFTGIPGNEGSCESNINFP